MKNLLILIVAGAVFLHFYPQPELEDWYNEQKEYAISVFNDATDTKVRLKSQKIFEDLENQFDSFSSDEIDYLKEISQSRQSVVEFYQEHCQQDIMSSLFHRENQHKVCKVIDKYQSLF